jgi:uncharacterized cupin superfamily protein
MKVILTEEQLKGVIRNELMENVVLEDEATQQVMTNVSNAANPNVGFEIIKKALENGFINIPTALYILAKAFGDSPALTKMKNLLLKFSNKNKQVTNQMQADAEQQAGMWKNNFGNWKIVSDDVIATVYNAVPQQCNNDVVHTASMFKLNLGDVLSQRVIAMERTFMAELGLKYGDVVYVDGTGKWDGPWQIQDTMNKRFAGMHKIDILVPRDIRTGMWKGVKISVPADQQTTANAKSTMKGSV